MSSQIAQLMEKQVIKRRQNFSTKTPEQLEASSSCDSESPSGDRFLKKPIKKRRSNLPKEATRVLLSWLEKNLYSAYPSEAKKTQLAFLGNVTRVQVSNWFINARRRYVPNLIEKDGGDPCLYKATRKSLHTVKRLGQNKQRQVNVQTHDEEKKCNDKVSSPTVKISPNFDDGPPMLYNLRLLSTVACEHGDKIGTEYSC